MSSVKRSGLLPLGLDWIGLDSLNEWRSGAMEWSEAADSQGLKGAAQSSLVPV